MKFNNFFAVILVTFFATSAFSTNLLSKSNAGKWVIVLSNKSKMPEEVFTINKGILKVGNATSGYIRTNKVYKNYTLALEWRWTKKAGNSGVLVHIQPNDSVWPVCFQVQQKADAAGDIICMNGLWANECTDKVKFTVPKMLVSNEKAIGEWNKMQVISEGSTLTVYINGVLQNKVTGLTRSEGFIGFQGEGTEMEFRNVSIMKLRK